MVTRVMKCSVRCRAVRAGEMIMPCGSRLLTLIFLIELESCVTLGPFSGISIDQCTYGMAIEHFIRALSVDA